VNLSRPTAFALFIVTGTSISLGADDEPTLTFSAVTISIAADGTGKLTVDSRDAEQSHAAKAPKAKPIEMALFGEAEVFPAKEGRLHVRYDFAKFKALDQLKSPAMTDDEKKLFERISIDPDEGALVLNPGSVGTSRLRLPRVTQGALDFKVCFAGATDVMLQLLIENSKGTDLLSFRLRNDGTIVGTDQTLGTKRMSNILKVTQPMGQKKDFDFKIASDWSGKRTTIVIGILGDVPVAIHRLEIIAKFAPSFGIGLAQKGTRIIVEKVLDGGAGAAAGLKAGDTILSINDQAVEDLAGGLRLLGDCPLDKDAVIVVERFGKKRTISVTPK